MFFPSRTADRASNSRLRCDRVIVYERARRGICRGAPFIVWVLRIRSFAHLRMRSFGCRLFCGKGGISEHRLKIRIRHKPRLAALGLFHVFYGTAVHGDLVAPACGIICAHARRKGEYVLRDLPPAGGNDDVRRMQIACVQPDVVGCALAQEAVVLYVAPACVDGKTLLFIGAEGDLRLLFAPAFGLRFQKSRFRQFLFRRLQMRVSASCGARASSVRFCFW